MAVELSQDEADLIGFSEKNMPGYSDDVYDYLNRALGIALEPYADMVGSYLEDPAAIIAAAKFKKDIVLSLVPCLDEVMVSRYEPKNYGLK